MSIEQFLNMGGYASYVWTSYGLVLALLVLNVVLPLRNHRHTRESIARLLAQQERKRK